jgi:flagellin
MGFSVNTNVGAMAALQSLTETNKGLSQVQSRINTGLKVASTKDDSASYTIAQGLRGDMGGLKAVSSSLSRAKSVTDVAVAGAEQISDVVNQMKAKAYQAADAGIDTPTRDALNSDFVALRDQITTIVNSSDFNGTNLLKASGGTVSRCSRCRIRTPRRRPPGIRIRSALPTRVSTLAVRSSRFRPAATSAARRIGQAMIDTLTTTQANLKTSLSTLGAASRKIDAQSTFTSKLSDSIEGGIGNLVDADLAKESAKLQALQVKQQLGVQALSIANQAPQTITSLFR